MERGGWERKPCVCEMCCTLARLSARRDALPSSLGLTQMNNLRVVCLLHAPFLRVLTPLTYSGRTIRILKWQASSSPQRVNGIRAAHAGLVMQPEFKKMMPRTFLRLCHNSLTVLLM